MAFIETPRFPETISFGAKGGPKDRVQKFETTGGFEQRNILWSQQKSRWDVVHGLKTADQLQELIRWFRAARATANGFRFKDWTDYKHDMTSTPSAVQFGTGNGTGGPFQLTKTYAVGSQTYVRDIRKPISGTIGILVDDVLKTETTDYTIAYATGLVTFTGTIPTAGQTLKWTGEFDVPVRFDSDEMPIEIEFHELHNWELKVVEIRT